MSNNCANKILRFLFDNKEHIEQLPKTYVTFRNKIYETINLINITSTELVFNIPTISRYPIKIKFEYFNLIELIEKLLNDTQINESNIYLKGNKTKYGNYGQCHNSLLWKYNENKLNENEVLLGIIIYSDETNLSFNGRQTAKPVVISIANFDKEIMHNHYTKKLICFIPNAKYFSDNNILKKQLFHKCISTILQPLIVHKNGF